MNAPAKIVLVVAILAAVIALKHNAPSTGTLAAPAEVRQAKADEAKPPALPQMVDLGAGKCIPCKAMAPILQALRHDFQDQFQVTFIDVWMDQAAGEAYNIRIIPTQIFFDEQGNELFRHEGFYSRQQILGKWRELGYEFQPAAAAEIPS
jgi:thioredoxin 1